MLPLSWSILLTVVFTVIGGYCVWHWISSDRAGAPRTADTQLVHLNHAAMSVIMIAMIWWPAGSVESFFQALIFIVFALAQIISLLAMGRSLRRFDLLTHVAMNLVMVWMLLAMPVLMGHSMGGAGSAAAHHGGGTQGPAEITGTPLWAEVINGFMIAVSVAIALWWLARLFRTSTHRFHFLCHAGGAAAMATMLVLM